MVTSILSNNYIFITKYILTSHFLINFEIKIVIFYPKTDKKYDSIGPKLNIFIIIFSFFNDYITNFRYNCDVKSTIRKNLLKFK